MEEEEEHATANGFTGKAVGKKKKCRERDLQKSGRGGAKAQVPDPFPNVPDMRKVTLAGPDRREARGKKVVNSAGS